MSEANGSPPAAPVNDAWGMPLHVFYCPHCRSAHLAPTDVPLATCPACLQAAVTPQPERMRREPPELVIPFAVDEEHAGGGLDEWSRGGWFRPGELRSDVLRGRLRYYYFPLWLVDSDIEATWQAEMGFDYQAASFQERYQGGRWVSQEITETRTRWEPRVGRLQRHYDNIVVPALTEHERWMSRLGRYDLRSRKAYSPRALPHTVVHVPDHAPEAAWPDAESAFNRVAASDCRAASEADHIRNWAMRAQFKGLNWTQMLLPAYVTYYQEGEAVYPVWVNGQSGHVYGVRVMSQRKANTAALVIGAVAALCFLLGALVGLLGAALVLPAALGAIFILLGVFLGLLAPVPAIWVWLSNRGKREQGTQSSRNAP
jgi:hypothetical protein